MKGDQGETMDESLRLGKLNSKLTECEQIYRRLESIVPDFSLAASSMIPVERRRFFTTGLYYLLNTIEDVEHLLRQVMLDGALQNIAPRPLQFYREDFAPNRENCEHLLADLMELHEIELDKKEFPPDYETAPIWNILISGLDFWEMDDSGQFSPKDLKTTETLIYSPFFNPDEWMRNLTELEPILGPAATEKIPSNIRIRVKELYSSFVLGNYLSAVALARAILEYTLVDRATRIGISAYSEDRRYPNRTRRLRELVEDVSKIVPELRPDMETVLDAGNRTLHPKKKDKVVLLPNHLRILAEDSVASVRTIVEKLYLHL